MYFIYGIINSSYNRDLTHLNNVIIPFLELHNKDTTSTKNYYEHYIISNVLASILNGNINLELSFMTPAFKAFNAAVKAADDANTALIFYNSADTAYTAYTAAVKADGANTAYATAVGNLFSTITAKNAFYTAAKTALEDPTTAVDGAKTAVDALKYATTAVDGAKNAVDAANAAKAAAGNVSKTAADYAVYDAALAAKNAAKTAKAAALAAETAAKTAVNYAKSIKFANIAAKKAVEANDHALIAFNSVKDSNANVDDTKRYTLSAVIHSAHAANYAAIAAYYVANFDDKLGEIQEIIQKIDEKIIMSSNLDSNDVDVVADNISELENLIIYKDGLYKIDHLDFDKKYESYNDIKSLNINFKPFSDKDTINQDDFKKYYMKTYENIYDYKYFKNDYELKGNSFKLDEFYEKDDKKTNIFSNLLLNNIPEDIKIKLKEIIDGTSNGNDRNKSINNMILAIETDIKNKINDYKYIIYYIIEKCIKLFNHKNFLKNNNKYNEDIIKLFKFELTNNNLEATPYKFILNIKKKEDFNIFFNEYKKEENESEMMKKMKKIVDNFITINYHIAFNTLNMKKNIDYYNDLGETDKIAIKLDIIDNLNRRHIRYNKKLYGLLIESHDINDYDIDETFYESEDLDKLKKGNAINHIKDEYKNLNYNYNILMQYESSNVTISNNYLKNIIKSIYYQINNKNINFEVEKEDNKIYKININKKPNKETNIIENILHNSNYIKGQGLFINYVINIIFIAIIYNIGYNM
jgi:hypothetical protein